MADVKDVAQIIINYMNAEEEPYITNLMLNKLLYFAQGHCLAETGKPLFDDDFEASEYSPVIPKIYHKYKVCGKHNILPADNIKEIEVLDNEQLSVLGCVLEQYGDYSPSKLVNITHELDSPWDKARKKDTRHASIMKEDIKNYFSSLNLEDFDEDKEFSEQALQAIEEYRNSVHQEGTTVTYPLKEVKSHHAVAI